MNLLKQKNKELLKFINEVVDELKLEKPQQASTIQDLAHPENATIVGKNLSEMGIEDVRLCSGDICCYVAEAYRYYTPQFMFYYLINFRYIFEMMFFAAYKPQFALIDERYWVFGKKEVLMIVKFFEYIKFEMEFYGEKFKDVDFDAPNSKNDKEIDEKMHYLNLIDEQESVEEALCFWQEKLMAM